MTSTEEALLKLGYRNNEIGFEQPVIGSMSYTHQDRLNAIDALIEAIKAGRIPGIKMDSNS